jgi:hypothetical protein
VDSTTYSYGGYIYAVTQANDGPRIYRSADGVTWNLVTRLDTDQSYGRWFTEFNGALYLGTVAMRGETGTTARIYRSFDGMTWTETRTKRGQLRGRGHCALIPRITLHAGIPPAEVSTQIAVQCLRPDLQ